MVKETKKIVPIDQEIHNVKHLLKVVLKNQEAIKAHLWVDVEDGEHGLNNPVEEHAVKFQEEQAEKYFAENVLPELEAKSRGELMAEGFFDGVLLNYLKEQALVFIGTILKKVVIQGSVDLAKWLMDEAEKVIVNLYGRATEEEKEAFKDKVKEVFPDSPLLEKLNNGNN